MYTKEELQATLFFDIETTPKLWSELSSELKSVWREKYYVKSVEAEEKSQRKKIFLSTGKIEDLKAEVDFYTEEEIFLRYASLYPEFSRVLCIVIGIFDEEMIPEIENVKGDSEKQIISNFFNVITKNKNLRLGGFNIKGFDIPYLIKRSYEVKEVLPTVLRLRGKKPWEISFLDLMEDYKGLGWEMPSLDLVTTFLGNPSSKALFHASEVAILLDSGKITKEDVIKYCARDVKSNMLDCKSLLY